MNNTNVSALDAINEAQKIAFAPVVFQVVAVLLKRGVLECISKHKEGVELGEIAKHTAVSEYGLNVLLELALCAGIVLVEDKRYRISKTAHFLLYDKMTRVNFNFIQDVCYKGMHYLDECIETGKPVGLKELGPWETIYQGLSVLPEEIKKSWFDFDHFYSDDSFPMALDLVFESGPQHIVDIGGNTGKWALQCCDRSSDVQVSILDLPVQLAVAKDNIHAAGKSAQVGFYEVNVLDEDFYVPDADIIWMSQFLDCFSRQEIVAILKNIAVKMSEGAQIFIMETFWDNQRFPAASFAVAATSVYFTALANGNSKMYGLEEMQGFVKEAGLHVREVHEDVGISHTILVCGLHAK